MTDSFDAYTKDNKALFCRDCAYVGEINIGAQEPLCVCGRDCSDHYGHVFFYSHFACRHFEEEV